MVAKAKVNEAINHEGLPNFLFSRVTLICSNYIYTGVLSGVGETCVRLTDAYIVYETGEFTNANWQDAQKLPHDPWYVKLDAIESFGKMK